MQNTFEGERENNRFKTRLISIAAALSVFTFLSLGALEAKPADDFLRKGKELLSGGHFPAAVNDFSKAIELNPKLAEAYQLRGWILFFMGKPSQALSDLDLAIKLDPNKYDSWTSRGEVLRQLAKYDESRQDFDKAIKLKPKEPSAYYLRGLSSLLQGLHVRARQDFTTAISLAPTHKYVNFAYYWRGRTNEMQEDYKAAVADYSKSISLGSPAPRLNKHVDPDAIYMYSAGESKSTALGLLERGLSYSQLGEHTKAIEDLTKVIAASPKETLLYEKRGLSLLALGRYKDALKDFNKALLLGTESGDVYFGLAISHFCLKKFENTASDVKAWLSRTFWEDDKKNPLAVSISYTSLKRTNQDAKAKQLAVDSIKGMAKTLGWRKSFPQMLNGKITPDQFVGLTNKAPLKDRTQANCYAALYLSGERKPKEAQKFWDRIKAEGDKNVLEFSVFSAEVSSGNQSN